MKRKSNLGKVRKIRPIDRMVKAAAKRLGGMLKLFEHACKSAFGRLFDPIRMQAAHDRYVARRSLARFVRDFVYKGLHMKIPAYG